MITASSVLPRTTKFFAGDKAAAVTDLQVGTRVVAQVDHKGDTLTAREVRFATPAGNKPQEQYHH